MTETEWLTDTDPQRLLAYLRGRVSDRKLRLFCIAAWERSIRSRPNSPRHQQVRQAALRFADGEMSREIVLLLAGKEQWAVMAEPAWDAAVIWASEAFSPCRLIREIFGNPFRPPGDLPSWKTRTVLDLAQAIYPDEAFDRFPILADALEEAGCTHAGMLEHCRVVSP